MMDQRFADNKEREAIMNTLYAFFEHFFTVNFVVSVNLPSKLGYS